MTQIYKDHYDAVKRAEQAENVVHSIFNELIRITGFVVGEDTTLAHVLQHVEATYAKVAPAVAEVAEVGAQVADAVETVKKAKK